MDERIVWRPWIKPVKSLDWGAPRLTDDELQARLARGFGRAPFSDDVYPKRRKEA